MTDNYPPAAGGIERYVESLSRHLVAEGHQVAVVTLAHAGAPRREVDKGVHVYRLTGLTQFLPRSGNDPAHVFHPTVPDPPLAIQLQAVVRQYRPQVIHVHGWILASCLALRAGRASLVVHLHDYGIACIKKTMMTRSGPCRLGPGLVRCTRCAADQYGGTTRSALLAGGLRAMRPFLGRADAFIANSKAVAAVSRLALPVDEPITVLPTSVADDLADLAERTSIPSWLPTAPYLLFVGALGPHKGIDVLLEARALAQERLSLVVLGIPRHDTPMMNQEGVVVRHNVPIDQVMVSWRQALIGVVPSVCQEAFGQVAVECQSVGTPVIVSGTGGLADLVQDGVSGLVVPPGNAPALAQAIDRLARDPELRARLGRGGRARAAELTFSSTLPRLLDVYTRAMARRSERLGASP